MVAVEDGLDVGGGVSDPPAVAVVWDAACASFGGDPGLGDAELLCDFAFGVLDGVRLRHGALLPFRAKAGWGCHDVGGVWCWSIRLRG